MASYAGHLQYFGSPQKYASQIQATGYGNLSDKGAATDFIRDNPGLFGSQGSLVPGTPQQSTSWTPGGIVPGSALKPFTTQQQTQQTEQDTQDQFTGTLPTRQYAPMMPWEEAMRMAGEKLDPLTELARMNLNNTFNKQRKMLPKQLNARGQLYGGLRAGGESQLTQDQGSALEALTLRANAEKSSMAENIRNFEHNRAMKQADDMYQSELDKYKMNYDKWKTGMDNYRTDTKEKNSRALALENLRLQQEAAKRAADQQVFSNTRLQEQDVYKKERDVIGDQRYAQEFGLKQRETDYATSKPYYNPNTGAAPRPTQTEIKNNAMGSAYDAVDSAFSAGMSAEQVINNIRSQSAALVRNGIDPEAVVKYAESHMGATPPPPVDNWYDRADNFVGGWLPGGNY